MSESARVTDLQALADFRAALGTFQAEAQEALTVAAMELYRTSDWLEEQGQFWKHAVHGCEGEVAEARAALASRKLFKLFDRPPDCTEQEHALRLAERRLAQAQEKVETCGRWRTLLRQAVEEYDGPVRRLAGLLETDVPRGLALLERMSAALAAYVELRVPAAAQPVAKSKVPPPG